MTARIFRYFWRQWRDELTPAGKIVVWGICVTGLGTIELQMPVYQLFFGLVTLLSVGATAGYLFRPRVSIRGAFPDRGAAGHPLTGHFVVENQRSIPAYDVGLNVLGLPETFETKLDENLVPRIGPGEKVSMAVTVTPKRRGRYQLPDLRAYSCFPFALGRSGKAAKELPPMIVLPSFEPLAGFRLPIGTRYQPGGIVLTSHVGESPEYIGNREYVPGEPIRRLDFRAWARTGKPVVREYQEEYYCRIALILDTSVPVGRRAGPAGYEELEGAVSLTAAIADALSGGEYVIDLFAAGPELHVFRSGRHTANFENVLEILAGVEPAKGDCFSKLSPAVAEELSGVSTAIVVLLDWSPSRQQLINRILEAGCSLKTLLVVRDQTRDAIDASEIPECTVLEVGEIGRGLVEVR